MWGSWPLKPGSSQITDNHEIYLKDEAEQNQSFRAHLINVLIPKLHVGVLTPPVLNYHQE